MSAQDAAERMRAFVSKLVLIDEPTKAPRIALRRRFLSQLEEAEGHELAAKIREEVVRSGSFLHVRMVRDAYDVPCEIESEIAIIPFRSGARRGRGRRTP